MVKLSTYGVAWRDNSKTTTQIFIVLNEVSLLIKLSKSLSYGSDLLWMATNSIIITMDC